MPLRGFTNFLLLLLSVASLAESSAGAPAQSPAATADAHRYLEPGSWIITETRSNDGPAAVRRKVAVVGPAEGGQRAIEESKWVTDAFQPAGPARPLTPADRRTFDEICPKPQSLQPDRVVTIGPKRYVCRVATYPFRDDASGRTTVLTLWRDKSGGTQLPPRTVPINGKEIPLPTDALQAEIAVEGPGVSTKAQRRIAALSSPLRVNGQTCSCLVEITEIRGTQAGKPLNLSVQEWYCHDLPGERLRTATSGTVGGAAVESEVKVLDFFVAKPAAAAANATAVPAGHMPSHGAGDTPPPTILPSAE